MPLLLLLLIWAIPGLGQWTQEWTSPSVSENSATGWLAFQHSAGNWEYRYYEIDASTFRIMSGPYSSTPQYTYGFTAPEVAAGNYIYSLSYDLTGDGIVEFYVLSDYETTGQHRQAFRILNIVNGQTIFQRDDAAASFGSPYIYDLDDDGTLECFFTRSPFPEGTTYFYEVFDTGAGSAIDPPPATPRAMGLCQNSPNPFNGGTSIEYELPASARAELEIFNLTGQKVRSLSGLDHAPGSHRVTWDGCDERGIPLASGAYYYSLRTDEAVSSARQMILLR